MQVLKLTRVFPHPLRGVNNGVYLPGDDYSPGTNNMPLWGKKFCRLLYSGLINFAKTSPPKTGEPKTLTAGKVIKLAFFGQAGSPSD